MIRCLWIPEEIENQEKLPERRAISLILKHEQETAVTQGGKGKPGGGNVCAKS